MPDSFITVSFICVKSVDDRSVLGCGVSISDILSFIGDNSDKEFTFCVTKGGDMIDSIAVTVVAISI